MCATVIIRHHVNTPVLHCFSHLISEISLSHRAYLSLPGMVAQACSPSTLEAEAEDQEIKVILSYIVNLP